MPKEYRYECPKCHRSVIMYLPAKPSCTRCNKKMELMNDASQSKVRPSNQSCRVLRKGRSP